MRPRPGAGASRSILVSLLIVLSTPALAAFKNDFSAYPAGAQSCLNSASDASNCSGDTVKAMNTCLCGNGGNFVLAAAQCIGQNSPSDVASTYTELAVNCQGSNTPLTVSQAQFLAAASGSATTTTATKTTSKKTTATTVAKTTTKATSTSAAATTAASTSATTSATYTGTSASPAQTSNADNNNKGGGGLSTTAKIAIAAVVAAVAVAAVVGIFLFLRRRRRLAAREEARPMLDQYPPTSGFAGAGGPGSGPGDHSPRPSELSTYYDPASIKPGGGDVKPGLGAASETDTAPNVSPYSTNTAYAVPHKTWDPTSIQPPQAWGPTPPPQQLHPAWAAGAQAPQQWHQPPVHYAELSPQQQQPPQPQIYELASMPPSSAPPARYNAVEMPASPAVQPGGPLQPGGGPQQYPGQWRRGGA